MKNFEFRSFSNCSNCYQIMENLAWKDSHDEKFSPKSENVSYLIFILNVPDENIHEFQYRFSEIS